MGILANASNRTPSSAITPSLHHSTDSCGVVARAGRSKPHPQLTYPQNRMIRSMFIRSTSLIAAIPAIAFAFGSASPVFAQ